MGGKPIIRGLIGAATTVPDKPEGWYHYEWPVPGGLLPRWKSSYVQLVTAPSGARYVVGAGMYNDRMERAFVVGAVTEAVARIEKEGEAAFALLRNPTGPFIAKDTYVFVYDMNGVNLVLPPFPNLEGRSLLDMKDTRGKAVTRDMLELVRSKGSGWVDYMWPKPGESVSTQKSAYVTKAKMGDRWVLVGSGVYLADAPKAAPAAKKMTAPELMALVRDGAAVFEEQGEKACPEFRRKGSKWCLDDTYFFVWTMDGARVFHAADPASEGRNVRGMKDVLGRPFGEMILEAARSASGEGWVHYMYPEPGGLFPTWKSTFVKRVSFPSGTPHLVGCGIYDMQMDEAFVEDVVGRAAALIADRGKGAFDQLRDERGAFRFMDTYVFVYATDGTELVNPAQPSLEGKNLSDLKDVKGKAVARESIAAALKQGSAWVEYYWYKPGENTPSRKRAYVRKVQVGEDRRVGCLPGLDGRASRSSARAAHSASSVQTKLKGKGTWPCMDSLPGRGGGVPTIETLWDCRFRNSATRLPIADQALLGLIRTRHPSAGVAPPQTMMWRSAPRLALCMQMGGGRVKGQDHCPEGSVWCRRGTGEEAGGWSMAACERSASPIRSCAPLTTGRREVWRAMPRLFAFLAVALAACDSGSAVTQPIAFNHKAHIDSGLECTFCHESVENEETAGVPTTETCVACHEDTASLAATGHDVALADGTEKEKLHAYLARGGPVPWRRIYDLPDHVYFSHRRHVSVAGIECGECHGDVSNLSVPASRPLVDHDMDWCTGCHEARGASNDCIHCHT